MRPTRPDGTTRDGNEGGGGDGRRRDDAQEPLPRAVVVVNLWGGAPRALHANVLASAAPWAPPERFEDVRKDQRTSAPSAEILDHVFTCGIAVRRART